MWTQFGMTCYCTRNLMFPRQPYFDRHIEILIFFLFSLTKFNCQFVFLNIVSFNLISFKSFLVVFRRFLKYQEIQDGGPRMVVV